MKKSSLFGAFACSICLVSCENDVELLNVGEVKGLQTKVSDESPDY